MKPATYFIYVVCFLFIKYASNVEKKNLILKSVNENNEETKMSRKSEINLYLEVAIEVSPRTTSSPPYITRIL